MFAYGPADATASQIPSSLASFNLRRNDLPRLSWKSGQYTGVVVAMVFLDNLMSKVKLFDKMIQNQ